MAADVTPPWDQETTLERARDQVVRRVDEQATTRGVGHHWLSGADLTVELAAIERLGSGAVVGSDMVLWSWSPTALNQLSAQLRRQDGLLVYLEPTAGLGLRRAMQLLGRRYRQDVPAALRSAGLIVTTQVRLRHGVIGTFVRGEARHFD
jgi:hypothetical protein